MGQDNKKRHIISYENMPRELAEAFAEKYPKGFTDYLPDLLKYDNPDGTSFYAVTVEIPSAIYLVKIKVLEGEEEAENEEVAGTSGSVVDEEGTLPDDNIAQYGTDDDSSDSGE